MGADRAFAAAQILHDRGDRNHRSVAGEDRIRAGAALELGKNFLLQLEIFRYRLDHVVGVMHRISEIDRRLHALDGALVFAKIAQIGGNARCHRVEILHHRIGDLHLMAGQRKNLRDAVAHQAGADDGDARLCHCQPAV
jgi:hypothetical protein